MFPSTQESMCTISIVQPIPLTSIFLLPLSAEAHDIAITCSTTLESWLCYDQRILRQGRVFSFRFSDMVNSGNACRLESDNSSLCYELLVTEPVLQGHVQRGLTEIIVLPAKLVPTNTTTLTITKDVGDDDSLEIDEAFLANAMFSGIPSHALSESSGVATSLGTIPTTTFVVEPVSRHIDPVIDNYTAFIRTSDLLKVGLRDGDWVRVMFCLQLSL
jgi:hypothetical protein